MTVFREQTPGRACSPSDSASRPLSRDGAGDTCRQLTVPALKLSGLQQTRSRGHGPLTACTRAGQPRTRGHAVQGTWFLFHLAVHVSPSERDCCRLGPGREPPRQASVTRPGGPERTVFLGVSANVRESRRDPREGSDPVSGPDS